MSICECREIKWNYTIKRFFFGHASWHVASQFPNQRWNPSPLHWKHRVSTTGPPGKSLAYSLLCQTPFIWYHVYEIHLYFAFVVVAHLFSLLSSTEYGLQFCLQETSGNVWRQFRLSQLEVGGHYWYSVDKARDIGEECTTKNYLAQYVKSGRWRNAALQYFSGEGNGTPLQYFCLENPMDGGAWWAAVYGVPQSRTCLKRLSSSSSSSSISVCLNTFIPLLMGHGTFYNSKN